MRDPTNTHVRESQHVRGNEHENVGAKNVATLICFMTEIPENFSRLESEKQACQMDFERQQILGEECHSEMVHSIWQALIFFTGHLLKPAPPLRWWPKKQQKRSDVAWGRLGK